MCIISLGLPECSDDHTIANWVDVLETPEKLVNRVLVVPVPGAELPVDVGIEWAKVRSRGKVILLFGYSHTTDIRNHISIKPLRRVVFDANKVSLLAW